MAFLELIKWGHFGGHDKCIGTKTGSIREVNTIRYDMKTFIAPSKTDMLQIANLRRCPYGQKLLPVIIVHFYGYFSYRIFRKPVLYITLPCILVHVRKVGSQPRGRPKFRGYVLGCPVKPMDGDISKVESPRLRAGRDRLKHRRAEGVKGRRSPPQNGVYGA